jgi:hypothetical protein
MKPRLGKQQARICGEIIEERARQDNFVATGKFKYNCASPDTSLGDKMLVLAEEFGEVARAAYEIKSYPGSGQSESSDHLFAVMREKKGHLRTELIQLAACCVAWAESLEQL